MTAKEFPISIKIKASERFLMKIKLLSLPSEKAEILVGEGVTNIDSKIIDNSLRVPIYDKKQGV